MTTSPHFDGVFESPIGWIGLRLDAAGRLAELDFLDAGRLQRTRVCGQADPIVDLLSRYFEDPLQPLDHIELSPQGTAFQQSAWRAMRALGAGEVRTYGGLAASIGTGPRALAGACRANPVPLVTPCHRVVAARGLGGYCGVTRGAGLARKRWLLRHEGVALAA